MGGAEVDNKSDKFSANRLITGTRGEERRIWRFLRFLWLGLKCFHRKMIFVEGKLKSSIRICA
jgi:hypothetical protein